MHSLCSKDSSWKFRNTDSIVEINFIFCMQNNDAGTGEPGKGKCLYGHCPGNHRFCLFCVEKQSLHRKYHIELSPPECDNIVANGSTCV